MNRLPFFNFQLRMGHASEIPDEPLKNGDTMGSLLVYKCSHCGASKATNKLHFMLLCDYCGGLFGFDDFGFARSDHYQNLLSKMQTDVASPGTTAYRLRQLFYCEMEEARLQHQRQIWHDKAEEYYRLYYNYYYESFLREYVDDPRYQLENMVRTSLLWYEVSYFDERMTQSWGEYEKAWNEFEKRPDENSLRQAERLISLYTSVLEKLFEIITPAKLDVNCQAHELVRGTLSRWFHQIVTDTGLPPAMRQAIAELYEKMSPGLCNQKEKKRRCRERTCQFGLRKLRPTLCLRRQGRCLLVSPMQHLLPIFKKSGRGLSIVVTRRSSKRRICTLDVSATSG